MTRPSGRKLKIDIVSKTMLDDHNSRHNYKDYKGSHDHEAMYNKNAEKR